MRSFHIAQMLRCASAVQAIGGFRPVTLLVRRAAVGFDTTMPGGTMPELPEVETVRRQLTPKLIGHTIEGCWTFGTPKFDQAPHAFGQICDVRRRGKFLIIELANDKNVAKRGGGQRTLSAQRSELVIHLGMTGRLMVTAPDGEHDRGFDSAGSFPSENVHGLRFHPRPKHLRVRWLLDGGDLFDFVDVRRFGRVYVVPAGDYRGCPTLSAMGPEPFDAEFTPVALRSAVNRSGRAIKTLLMSQTVVAGIGNIYADEALWRARIRPDRRTSISHHTSTRLHNAIIEVLSEGIVHGGTTLRDYVDADGAKGRHQLHLACYGRSGLPCERCGTLLRRQMLDARSTTWCPLCQR